MTDRELLELAAKAAGLDVDFNDSLDCGGFVMYRKSVSKWWNPLTNDGDALRLAVKLMIVLSRYESYSTTYALGNPFPEDDELIEWHSSNNNDPYAATRRAIVRAAAEIGKGMK